MESLEIEPPLDSVTERPVRFVYVCCFIAALNSANLGYDIGVMSGASLFIEEAMDLSENQVEILIGILNFCAMFGAAIAHVVIDRYGRRVTFAASCGVFVVGVLGMTFAPNYIVLLLCRVVTGVGVGVGLSVDPVYIAEVAPKAFRGELVTWSEISINVGILLGFIASYAFRGLPTDLAWRVMLGCGAVMPTVLLVLTQTVMPESPRWLIQKGREDEARYVLKRLMPPGADVDALIIEIKEAVVRENSQSAAGWSAVLWPASPGVRYALCVGVGVAALQQILAEESILFYTPRILQDMGMPVDRVFQALIAMGVIKTVCIVVAANLLDKRGRRPLLLLSVAGMGLSLFGLSLAFSISTGASDWGAVLAIWTYMSFFSLGIGPICWLLAAEVFPLAIRAKAMSLATVANRVFSTIIAASFLSWKRAMPGEEAGYFMFFAGLAAIAWCILYVGLPETKGQSLEEMAAHFDSLAAAHRSRRRSFRLCDQSGSNAGKDPSKPPASAPPESTWPQTTDDPVRAKLTSATLEDAPQPPTRETSGSTDELTEVDLVASRGEMI